jgi:hypothetical protein
LIVASDGSNPNPTSNSDALRPEIENVNASVKSTVLAQGFQAISNSWSVLGQSFLQLRDGATNTVSQSISAVNSMGQGVLNTTGLARWLSLSAQAAGDRKYDERHFFLVPYALALDGYSVATIRVLPKDVAPINDLPKRRFIHLANLESEAMLRKLLVDQSALLAKNNSSKTTNSGMGQSLVGIADQLDQLDSQLFYGALALGTVIAVINPIAGAIVAAKALAPSVIATLAKYGLRAAGSSLEATAIEGKVRAAQNDVIKQFSGSDVVRVINPMLCKLAMAIRTEDSEFDPIFGSHLDPAYGEAESKISDSKYDPISIQAILSLYDEVINQEHLHALARLGTEDIRWLRFLKTKGSPPEGGTPTEI